MEIADEHVGRYMQFFCGRRDAYALQTAEGTYYAVREEVTEDLVRAHLLGTLTAGWYALDQDNTVRWAALDADGEDGLSQLQRVGQALERKGWPAYLESSRRGGHLWVFLAATQTKQEWMSACAIRAVLHYTLAQVGLDEEVELFPKEDELREGGLGSLVRGPLGVHRACGKRFGFLHLETLESVGRNLCEQLDYIAGFGCVTAAQAAHELALMLAEAEGNRPARQLPRELASWERGLIQELREEVGDLYAFISQFVPLDESGRGHCPFHPPDRHPSFAVNREKNYWVDFHDRTGGDAIAFYQRLRGLSFVEAACQLAEMYGRPELVERIERREAMKRNKTEVLYPEQIDLLGSAERGDLVCLDCGQPMKGEFVDFPAFFVGILLYCSTCSFLEVQGAPAPSWGSLCDAYA